MSDEWPKTVRVGGRSYQVSPDMPLDEYLYLAQEFSEEAKKVEALTEEMDMPTGDHDAF